MSNSWHNRDQKYIIIRLLEYLIIPATMLVKILPTHILHLGGIKSIMKARKIFLWNVRTLAHASIWVNLHDAELSNKYKIWNTNKRFFFCNIFSSSLWSSDPIWISQHFLPTPSCHFIICCIMQIFNYGLLWKTFNRDIPTCSRAVKELMMLLFSFIHHFSLIKISGFTISLIDSPVLRNIRAIRAE